MYVDLDGACSASSPITCGVPQGSVLGPTLFNVYYSDVIAEFPHNEITLFADDTAIVASAPKTEELQVAMQSRLTRIDEYLQSLNMELNASKTQALAFFTESFPDLTVRGQAVQSCKSFKYLGVHIDSSLSWDIHAQHVINKVHKNLFVLHRCSGAANIDRRRLLFRAYIYPHFLYGIELFMHCSVALRAKLEALFRRCCRLVMRDTGLFHRITRVSLFSALNVLPLRLTFQYSSAVILYNVLVLNRVPSLRTLFEVVQATHYGPNS